MLAKIPFSFQRRDHLTPAAADFVARVGQRVYAFGTLDGQGVANYLSSSKDPLDVIAAYLVLTGYENPALNFSCDFNTEVDATNAVDIDAVYAYIKNRYINQPKFLETTSNTVNRLRANLAAGGGVGVDLFIYRIVDLMETGNAPEVMLSESLRRSKACVFEADTGIAVLRFLAVGSLAVIGVFALRKVFKG